MPQPFPFTRIIVVFILSRYTLCWSQMNHIKSCKESFLPVQFKLQSTYIYPLWVYLHSRPKISSLCNTCRSVLKTYPPSRSETWGRKCPLLVVWMCIVIASQVILKCSYKTHISKNSSISKHLCILLVVVNMYIHCVEQWHRVFCSFC